VYCSLYSDSWEAESMHVLQAPAERHGTADAPEWVSDWWMPAAGVPDADAGVDTPGRLAPAPVVKIEVTGRTVLPATVSS
jgi:hypothetical protein